MRKLLSCFLPLIAILLFNQSAKAQFWQLLFDQLNKAQSWRLTGNNDATSTSILGTLNNQPLRVFTNNAERIRIDPQGRVGIGTTVPILPLDVRTTASGMMARFNGGASGMNIGLYENDVPRGYIGSYSGNNQDVDFGTTTRSYNGAVHLTIKTVPQLTVDSLGNVGIGTTTPSQKLQVIGRSLFNGNLTINEGELIVSHTRGVGIQVEGTNGIEGYSDEGYGGYFHSNFGDAIYGHSVWGVGVRGLSDIGNAGFFSALNGGYGIYATANSNAYAGYFEGSVYATGIYQSSDKRLKKNIKDFEDAMSLIKELKPKQYEFNREGKLASFNLPQGTHYGLIAQDLETLLPTLVKEAKQDVMTPVKTTKEIGPDGKERTTILPAKPTGRNLL